MVGRVEGSGGFQPKSQATAATQEDLRFSFDPRSQTFGPMKTSVTKNIDHMTDVGEQVTGLKVPPDYRSQTFLTGVKTENKSKGAQIQANTSGINPQRPTSILSSVRSAMRTL